MLDENPEQIDKDPPNSLPDTNQDTQDENCEVEEEEEEDYSHETHGDTPYIDTRFKGKNIFKIIGINEVVVCLCEDGLYYFHVTDHNFDPSYRVGNLVHRKPELFFPVQFFDNKKVLDICMFDPVRVYVLCDDGIYTFGDELEYSSSDPDESSIETLEVTKEEFFSPDRLPVLFDMCSPSKLGKRTKSARSAADHQTKRVKCDDEEASCENSPSESELKANQ